MTSQTRMLIVLAFFGLGGAVVLMGMANRYSKMMERSARTPRPATIAGQAPPGRALEAEVADALRRVDLYVEVRRVLQDSIAKDMPPAPDVGEPQLAALRSLRERTTAGLGLADSDYADIRTRVRSLATRGAPPDDALSLALGQRSLQLSRVDLGPYERFDL